MVLSDESLVTPIKGATKWSLGINTQHSVFYTGGVGGIGAPMSVTVGVSSDGTV